MGQGKEELRTYLKENLPGASKETFEKLLEQAYDIRCKMGIEDEPIARPKFSNRQHDVINTILLQAEYKKGVKLVVDRERYPSCTDAMAEDAIAWHTQYMEDEFDIEEEQMLLDVEFVAVKEVSQR